MENRLSYIAAMATVLSSLLVYVGDHFPAFKGRRALGPWVTIVVIIAIIIGGAAIIVYIVFFPGGTVTTTYP